MYLISFSTPSFFAFCPWPTMSKVSKDSTYHSRLAQSKGKDFVELKMKSCSTLLFSQECKHAKTSQSHDLHILTALYSFVKAANAVARVISLRSHGGIISCKPCGFLYKSWDWPTDGALLLSHCFLWNLERCYHHLSQICLKLCVTQITRKWKVELLLHILYNDPFLFSK